MSASVQAVLPLRPYKGRGFSINLVHQEVASLRVRHLVAGAVAAYLVINAAILIWFLRDMALAEVQGRRIQAELQRHSSAVTLAALKQEIEALNGRAKEESAQLHAIVAQQQEQFPIGGRLAILVKTLPERTWITGLSGDRERRSLTVRVSCLVDPVAPNLLPAEDWTRILKADAVFSQGLTHLEVTSSSQQTQQGRAQRMDYEWVARW